MDIYNGPLNYAFLSYSHKDSTKVFEYANLLSLYGYRIWLDEGIDPGSEWAEFIAERIEKSSIFVVFLSMNSVQSSNVKGEIGFARSLEKPMLCLHLDEVVLTQGLQLQLNMYQHIHLYKYRKIQDGLSQVNKNAEMSLCRTRKEIEIKSEQNPIVITGEMADHVTRKEIFSSKGFTYYLEIIYQDNEYKELKPVQVIYEYNYSNHKKKKMFENNPLASALVDHLLLQGIVYDRPGIFTSSKNDMISFFIDSEWEHVDFDVGVGECYYVREYYEILNPFTDRSSCAQIKKDMQKRER